MRRPAYLVVLHASHAGLFMVLFGTALLLLFPDLRARFVGGYSTILREAHIWVGFASILAPVLIYTVSRHLPRMPPWRVTGWLRGLHLRYTYLVTLVFGGTGVVMWRPDSFSSDFSDSMFSTHEWLTYAVAVVLVLHIGVVVLERVWALCCRGSVARRSESRAKGDQDEDKAWLEEQALRRVLGGQRWR